MWPAPALSREVCHDALECFRSGAKILLSVPQDWTLPMTALAILLFAHHNRRNRKVGGPVLPRAAAVCAVAKHWSFSTGRCRKFRSIPKYRNIMCSVHRKPYPTINRSIARLAAFMPQPVSTKPEISGASEKILVTTMPSTS